MATSDSAPRVPRRRPPPPPPNKVRRIPPPPAPKPKQLQQTIFELPAETINNENGPFEIATNQFDTESRFDEQLQQAYLGNGHQNEENLPENDFQLSDNVLEQPLPPIS
jgi:hypothetical protein